MKKFAELGALAYDILRRSILTVFLNNLPVVLSRNVNKLDELVMSTSNTPAYFVSNFLPCPTMFFSSNI